MNDALMDDLERTLRDVHGLRDECAVLREKQAQMQTDLALAWQEARQWQQRCVDAEHKRDFYLGFSREVVTALTMIKGAADEVGRTVDDVIERAREAALTGTTENAQVARDTPLHQRLQHTLRNQ